MVAAVVPIIPVPVVNHWRVCLEGIIGFSAATVDYLFDDRVGIDTVDAFVPIPASSFDDWIKVTGDPKRFTPAAPAPAGRLPAGRAPPGVIAMSWKCCNQLKALRFYLDYCVLCGFALDVTVFDNATMEAWVTRVTFLSQKVGDLLPGPGKLLFLERWQIWEVQFKTYLGQSRSYCGGYPLTYVIRNKLVNATAAYTNIDDQMIDFLLLTTNNFLIDNRRVFDLLAVLLVDTTNYVYIQRFQASRDGRRAWLHLKLVAEGPERRRVRRTIAQTAVDTTKFNGRGNFTIKAYIS
jgi:hypothetical protein